MTDQTQDVPSDYHDIVKPAFEKDPWDHDYYDFVDTVDTNLKISDTVANRPTETDAPTDSWFEATDEGIVYRNDGTDGWSEIAYGKSASPTWTGQHTFKSPAGDVEITNGTLDIAQEFSTNGYNVYVQDTEPTAENVGDVWLDNSEAFN